MLRVIKVGGSLLTWDGFRAALSPWLEEQSPARNVLVVGGGPWVELLRHATKRFEIEEADAHWNCVKAMSVTAEMVSHVFRFPLVTDFGALKSVDATTVVFDVYAFLRDRASHVPESLPACWDVTSDSIAARVASVLDAHELVLVKSRDPPRGRSEELAAAGYVDGYFPISSASVQSVRFVNLRGWKRDSGAH